MKLSDDKKKQLEEICDKAYEDIYALGREDGSDYYCEIEDRSLLKYSSGIEIYCAILELLGVEDKA